MRDNPQSVPGFIFGLTDLNPAEMMIYATIYGFTAKGGKGYTGTLEYLKDTIHESKPATIAVLQRLMDKGYLVREKLPKGRSYAYKATLPKGKETLPSVSDEEVAELVNSLNHDSKETLPSVDKKLNQHSKETLPRKDNEIKGEINNEIKKETLKKKDGEEAGKKQGGKYLLSSVPYVNELIEIGYADKSDVIALEGVFGRLAIYPKEDVERVFYAFKGSLRPEDMAKGFPYFESYMREHLENEKGRNKYPRGNL